MLAQQLGLQGLLASESQGGSGAGFRELAVVLEEAGRWLYPGPLLATSLAVDSLVGADRGNALVQHLADGTLIGTVALDHTGGSSVTYDSGRLNGGVQFVIAAAVADVFVTVAGNETYVIEPGAPGVTISPCALVDKTRRLADVRFDSTPAQLLAAQPGVRRLRAAAAVAVACEQVGGAEAALHSALAYAKVRTQFGRTIGSFQSLKHHCAEVFLAVESGRAATRRAARALDEEDPEFELLASIAKAWCSDAYTHAVETSLQVHGGVGFTWEHITHYHLKRAKTSELLFGDSAHHRHLLAGLLGL